MYTKISDFVKEAISPDQFSTSNSEFKETLKINQVGTFFCVMYPTEVSELIDIVMETDPFHFALQIRGGLEFERVYGFFTSEKDANDAANMLLNKK
jgi:hypothetical protein